MPRDFPRTRRVGEQLQRELAALIRDEVRDPRVGLVSVSAVEVSRDLSHAKVYVSTLGEQEQITELLKALEGAAGYLRHLLGQTLKMRHVPQLHFKQDHSLQEGARLSALIDSAVQADAKHNDDTDPDND